MRSLRQISSERGDWLAIWPALGVVLLAALDLTVVAPVLPTVIDDLGINTIDADRYAWIVLTYLVAYTVTTPISGRLSDWLGRSTVFLAALALFAIGSIVTAIAGDLSTIIIGRGLQGLGGGAMLPVSMALVADVTPINRRAATLGLVAAVDTFGWVLGPAWGSIVSALFGTWRAIFWLNVPLGVIAALLLLKSNVGARRAERGAMPPIASVAVLALALLTFTIGISAGDASGSDQTTAVLGGSESPIAGYRWIFIGASVLAFVAFGIAEWRSQRPLIPRELLRSIPFRAATGANLLVGAAMIVAMVNAPLVTTLSEDADDLGLTSAVLLGGFTLLMAHGALLGGRLMRRANAAWTTWTGLILATVGFIATALWWGVDTPLLERTLTLGVAGLGLGIVIAPISERAIAAAKVRDYGLASGVVLLARLIGMSVGLAIVTRYMVVRIENEVSALPAVRPEPGESTSEFFNRQREILEQFVIPITSDTINETFYIAAGFCLVCLIIARWLVVKRER